VSLVQSIFDEEHADVQLWTVYPDVIDCERQIGKQVNKSASMIIMRVSADNVLQMTNSTVFEELSYYRRRAFVAPIN
jgi:hypothetical protein